MLRRLAIVLAFAVAACGPFAPPAPPPPGGPFVVVEVDATELRDARLTTVSDEVAETLRKATPSISYNGRGVLDGAAIVRLANSADAERAMQALSADLPPGPDGAPTLQYTVTTEGVIEARLTESGASALMSEATDRAVEVLRRRLDPLGRNEVIVTRQAAQRIHVRAPHMEHPNQLRRLIRPVGQLTFNLVREMSLEEAQAGQVPPGTVYVQPYPNVGYRAEVVERRAQLTGERLASALATTDAQTGQFVLSFRLDADGARAFCRVTRDHTGERFAILIDKQVLTAPMINEPICGGAGQISGNFTAESARELATMLQAGALPAPLKIVAQGVAPRS